MSTGGFCHGNLTGVGLTVVSHIGFAAFADGPWSAGAARWLT